MTMNRNSAKDSLIGIGARNLRSNGIHNVPRTGLLSHRRVMSLTSATEDFNRNSNNVDLFSRNRRTLSVASSDESDLQVRLGRLSAGSTKPAKNELDDLISSNEGGKHDYDWLLTPPETPLLPSSDGKESQPKSVTPRRNSSVRSGSTIQNTRLSASQSDSNHPSKPARSSSATRSAISTAQYTTRNPNILNTSSASVSSYINNRSSPATRPSTPRSSTPSRTRPPTTAARPSTPTSPAIRPASRPSTPTRRSTPTPSAVRVLSSNGPTSRPSSPGPRVRPPPQPIIPPDFPHETPPNLRTTMPERPLSAGRSRPGPAMTVKGPTETTNSRRQSSPIVTRGRLIEPPARLRPKPIKTSNSEGGTGTGTGTGFGRNISKKSLDMAIKHMDITSGGIRSALFPQSIRSSGPGTKNGSSFSCKIMEGDIYESSRYDAILLKEDLKNTSWLHSAQEKSDEGPLFDNGFEPLPEPFAPL